jgi:TonB family protein
MIPFAPGNGCGQSLIAFRFALPIRAGADTKNESLGSQMIEGVAADGFRITRTIPAGSIGNERQFEITYERWHSSELQLDVLIKSIDPRSGELTQQITNISLGEPDASLFEIPPDYTVQSFNRAQTATLGTVDRPQAATMGTVDRPQAATLETAASSDHQPAPQVMSASLKPTIIYRENAGYTMEARQNRVEGVVVLSVVFNVNGSITDVRVVRGLPDGLTEKAIEAAKKIRFQPAVKDGTPVSVRGAIEFSFKLDK